MTIVLIIDFISENSFINFSITGFKISIFELVIIKLMRISFIDFPSLMITFLRYPVRALILNGSIFCFIRISFKNAVVISFRAIDDQCIAEIKNCDIS